MLNYEYPGVRIGLHQGVGSYSGTAQPQRYIPSERAHVVGADAADKRNISPFPAGKTKCSNWFKRNPTCLAFVREREFDSSMRRGQRLGSLCGSANQARELWKIS